MEVIKMRKHAEIIKSANELYGVLTESFTKFAEIKKGQIDSLTSVSYEDAHTTISDLIEGARALIAGSIAEDGTVLPKYLTRFTTFEADGKITKVTIVLKSKLKDAIKYKKEVTIDVDADFMKNFVDAHVSAIFDLYYRYQANANLEEVNEFIKKICVENSIPYTFEFTITGGKEYLTHIDNDVVIFNASIEQALEVSKQGLFQSGDEYSDLVREQLTAKLVDALSSTQTTVQLVKANISIINTLIGFTTKKRADRLIRIAYHKKAEFFNKVKSGYGYFEIEQDDTTIFTILEKAEDGTISVALNPFDIKTLLTVDVDAVAELKKVLA